MKKNKETNLLADALTVDKDETLISYLFYTVRSIGFSMIILLLLSQLLLIPLLILSRVASVPVFAISSLTVASFIAILYCIVLHFAKKDKQNFIRKLSSIIHSNQTLNQNLKS